MIPIPTFTLDRTEKVIIAVMALFCFAVHLLTNLTGAYGFFRDELYYIACTDHLAWGYVDHPPFSLYVLKLSRLVFGDSLTAIRLVPSLAHAGTLVMTGLIVKQIGGGRIAILLACTAVLTSLIHIGMCLIFSMNAIDIFLWSFTAYIVLKINNTGQNSYWIALGFVLGIGLMNKISFLFLGAGLFVGLVFTSRQVFATRWPYYAGIIAGLLFLPYVIWNLTHDLAHLEFIHNASAGKYAGRTRLDFLREQFLLPNPISFPLWVSGLIAFFVYKPLKPYRILGWIYLGVPDPACQPYQ
jgi:4-amino-4-deoxy-L-arabinose transferase-like glycosyltransferase